MKIPESKTIPQLLQEQATRHASREALVDGRRRYTYAQLQTEVHRVARGLLALGIRRGDHVAILMGNRAEWMLSFLAVQQIGAVSVGLNTWSSAREMEYTLSHAEVRCLIATDRLRRQDFRAMLNELPREQLPKLQFTVWLGTDPAAPLPIDAAAGECEWDEMLRRGDGVAQAQVDAAAQATAPDDVAMLLYTSGSTAAPKGILLQHEKWIRNAFHIGERQHVTHEDRLWLAVSLFWSFGIVNAVPNLLTHGGCVVLQESFDAGEAMALIERERCSILYGTPNIVQALWEHPTRDRHDLSSLRSGAMIGTPAQVMRAVELGARDICNVYGLSETYGNCTVTDAHDPLEVRLNTVGKPLPGVTLRICHMESGEPLPEGEVGEIRVQGPLVKEYFKDPLKTAESFDENGFYRTGDMGLLDASGRLSYKGRLKEMVKSGGINIAPAEVEEVLMRHPAVRVAYVIGVPHPTLDEALVAIIVPQAGEAPSDEALKAFCSREMAAYKVPHRFHLTTESQLPLTTTGKVQKMNLHTLLS
ncbi:AMP-binding protein [Hydrogenophaga sp. BPS33]|uniref:AMP-binding protein n=1 Tax=Hydrogenophaga sp. BPS33 TaxID=2651974 RepID=UPI00131FEF68|nr:AMP-binding protein [Hydrogenophaga sp. BPS33]QHE84845.1 AMP-binding protein [Hydrogenophaga sp. BPS33]